MYQEFLSFSSEFLRLYLLEGKNTILSYLQAIAVYQEIQSLEHDTVAEPEDCWKKRSLN